MHNNSEHINNTYNQEKEVATLRQTLKGRSTRFLKNGEKILKNKLTNVTLLQFLQLIRLRKFKEKKIMFPF